MHILTSPLRKRPTNHRQIQIQVRRHAFLFYRWPRLTRFCVLRRVSGLSLEELGLRALERIPRDRAIDGIQAFMDLRFVDINKHGSSYLNPVLRQGWSDAIPQTVRGTRKRS